MFGSQKAYGANNQQKDNSTYGNNASSYYSSSTTNSNDSFWGNQHQQRSNNFDNDNNRLNYSSAARDPNAAVIANDSLYGYHSNIDKHSDKSVSKSDKYGNLASFASSAKKSTTWATIASQPAKSQPKSLKLIKMAGLTGTTSKHLPPTVAMDAMWDSPKNGVSIGPGGANKSSASTISVPPASVSPAPQPNSDDLYSPVSNMIDKFPPIDNDPPLSSAQQPQPVSRENSWNTVTNNGNNSPIDSADNSTDSRRTPAYSNSMPIRQGKYNEHNGNYNQNSSINYNQRGGNNMDYSHHQSQQSRPPVSKSPNVNHNQSYANNSNNNDRYPNHQLPPPPAMRDLEPEEDDEDENEPNANDIDDVSYQLLEKLRIENNYNPEEFELNLRQARFFIIKSYSEDDIHRSIKYSIWCSTEHGNKRLDNAFRQQEDKGPIYLFFSVNRSGHFCGVAQMMSRVDYDALSGVWSQDKWKGQFKVKWIYVKDVPNDELRHITLENNENKPVTNSRDTQEVPFEQGKKVMTIIHNHKHATSIFDDFLHYEKKQNEEKMNLTSNPHPQHHHQQQHPQQHQNHQHQRQRPNMSSPPPHVNNYYPNPQKPMQSNSYQPPPHRHESVNGPYRGNTNYNKPRSYPDNRGGGMDHRNGYRDSYAQGNAPPPPPQYRNNFRNNNNNNFGGHNYRGRDYNNRAESYYQRDSGYGRGAGNSDSYYSPPPQHDYGHHPPTIDHNRNNDGNHHSWRSN